ncbi:modulator protein [Escherichia coli]|nr:modulator protein [Escherichia coli]MCW7438258.1 modulator protein [Escherichia coli]
MKKRYYTVKHGTLRALQEFADKHNVEVRREGEVKLCACTVGREMADGRRFQNKQCPQGVRDRAFEEWEQIIIDNALLLNAD